MVSLTAHLVKQALAEPCYELGFDHQPPLDDALLAADVPFKTVVIVFYWASTGNSAIRKFVAP
jgi:hypothetical protein